MLTRVKPPTDPKTAATAKRLRAIFARGRTLFYLVAYDQLLSELQAAHDEAVSLGYLPLLAEATMKLGHIHAWMGRNDKAIELLSEAGRLALKARDYELAAVSWGHLVFNIGTHKQERKAALELANNALALLEGLPGTDEERSKVLARRGIVLAQDGNPALGVADLKEVLAIKVRIYGPDHPETAYSYYFLAGAQFDNQEYADALENAGKAAKRFGTQFSNIHPQSVRAEQLVARCRHRLGEPEKALSLLLELEPRLGPAFGDDPFQENGFYQYVLAEVLVDLERVGEARVAYESALAAFRRRYDEDNWRIVNVKKGLERLRDE